MAKRTKTKRRRSTIRRRSINIGIIHSGTSRGDHNADHLKAFRDGLALFSNVSPRPRFSGGQQEALDNNAKASVDAGVGVLVAAGGSSSANAAMRATSTIPIIVTSVSDSARPAPNVAGICCHTTDFDKIRLQKLLELLPGKKKIGVLYNPFRSDTDQQQAQIKTQAGLLGVTDLNFQRVIPNDNEAAQINTAFQNLRGYQAALIAADPLFNDNMDAVLKTNSGTLRDIPAIYQWREFAEEGGLISYGPNLSLAYKLAGTFAGRILSGETIDKLPLLPLNNAELVINLKRAKDLKIDVPPMLLAQANDVIVD